MVLTFYKRVTHYHKKKEGKGWEHIVGESNCGVCECEIMCVRDEMMVDFWWAQSKVTMCV